MGADPIKMAQIAADLGVRVYTIGVGTTQGTVLKARGMQARVKLDEVVLKRIADMTGANQLLFFIDISKFAATGGATGRRRTCAESRGAEPRRLRTRAVAHGSQDLEDRVGQKDRQPPRDEDEDRRGREVFDLADVRIMLRREFVAQLFERGIAVQERVNADPQVRLLAERGELFTFDPAPVYLREADVTKPKSAPISPKPSAFTRRRPANGRSAGTPGVRRSTR